MKLFFLMLLCAFFTTYTIDISAQGITKYGQSTSTSSSFVNSNGKIGSQAVLTKYGQKQALTIGMDYLGGKLAYLLQPGDPGYIEGANQGLIAASADQSAGAPFGTDGVWTNGGGTAIGTGYSNTTNIVAANSTAGIAARLCNDLVTGGYSDWFLPSRDELNKLYINRAAIGGFSGVNYWSSSETSQEIYDEYWDDYITEYDVFCQNFADGTQYQPLAGNNFRVRAIRSFGCATITTTAMSGFTATTATSGGNVISDGSLAVTAKGVCWSTSPNPTIADSKTTDGSGLGTFTSTLTGLTAGITYYVRSYATNNAGTSYGDEKSFTLGVIVMSTTAKTITSLTDATSGGNITSDGGAPVTARGVCWNTSPNPTIANSKTTDGTGTGSYTSTMSGLTAGATYYVRAYATNSAGTSYGNQISFKASIGLSYQGGIVAYILKSGDPGYNAGTIQGFVAAAADQSAGAAWGCFQNGMNESFAIGSGNSNTIDIVNSCAETGIAAKICNDLVTGGFSDWFLPSAYELQQLYTNQTLIGGFQAANYWSSTHQYWYDYDNEWDVYETYYVNFNDGNLLSNTENIPYRVRAIRYFGLPTVTTAAASAFTTTTATSGGNVTSDGGYSVTAKGICWNTSPNPTIANSKTTNGTGTGVFTSSLTGLTTYTTYYVRAYATNAAGTNYGNEVSFTIGNIGILTNSTSATSATTATSGGTVAGDGGLAITARGVCWSTTANPTIANSKTSDGTGIGSFTSSITGLTGGVTYYVRAYATNAAGTNYGIQTTVSPGVITISTNVAGPISTNSVLSGGNITSSNGVAVTARGVCWSTTSNPTIANSKTSDGTGTGKYTSTLTGLVASTTYYARAYATNALGTTYGDQITFTAVGIGSTYKGGILAYILQVGDPGYVAGESHGLIAAPLDLSASVWGGDINAMLGAGGTALGTGYSNSEIIASAYGFTTAAGACRNLSSGGYTDWYLPSFEELKKLYLNRALIGNLSNVVYWSSSEFSEFDDYYNSYQNYGYSVNFLNGMENWYAPKNESHAVRAVRSF